LIVQEQLRSKSAGTPAAARPRFSPLLFFAFPPGAR